MDETVIGDTGACHRPLGGCGRGCRGGDDNARMPQSGQKKNKQREGRGKGVGERGHLRRYGTRVRQLARSLRISSAYPRNPASLTSEVVGGAKKSLEEKREKNKGKKKEI